MFNFVKSCFSWLGKKVEDMAAVAPPPMVKRAEWGAESTEVTKKYVVKDLPIFLIYCSLKSHLEPCKTKEECCSVLKNAQLKFKKDGLGDIPYSFVISEDGTIYEGRGWEYKPQKAIDMEPKDFDARAYDIALFGDWSGTDVEVPSPSFKSLIDLLQYGVKRKYVVEAFDLEPFRDNEFKPRFCPGVEYTKQHVKEFEVDTVHEAKPSSPPKDKAEDDFFDFSDAKVKWDFPF